MIAVSRRRFVAAAAAGLAAPAATARLAAAAPAPAPARPGGPPFPVGALAPGMRIAPDREALVPVPGGRAYVRVNGDLAGPRPPIVLIHGGPGSSHWYFLNATALAETRAVILYDQLDSGRSDVPADPANWRLPRFVAELEAIRQHLAVPRWHVLGASWGGTVALAYGAARPPALAGLVLQSPLVSTAQWLADARRLKDAMPADMRDLLDRCDVPGAAPAEACDAATAAFYRRHVALTDPPAPVAAYKAGLPRAFSPEIYNHMWGRAEFTASGSLRDHDDRALLPKLDGARTLFVAGAEDEARPATVRGFARAAGARYRIVPDAAHAIFQDNPIAYLALLRAWLARMDRA